MSVHLEGAVMIRIYALLAMLTCLPAAPASGHRLFALVNTGELYASADRGATWVPRSTLPVSDAAGLIAGKTSAQLFIASRSGLVYRSLDSGFNWSAMGSLTSDDVMDIQARSDGALVVLTSTGAVWVSDDDGASFTLLAALTGSNYVSLAVSQTGNLYALTETGEVEESTDGGSVWMARGAISVPDAVEIRSLGSNLYVLTGTGLIARSADFGSSWLIVGTLSQVHMRGLTQDIDQLAAITQEGEVALSTNGSSWTWVGTVNQLVVMSLASDTPYVIGVPEQLSPTPPVILSPPVPNPLLAGGSLALRFRLAEPDRVGFFLFDFQGRQVSTRDPESFDTAGEHEISWRFDDVSSGIYVVQMKSAKGMRESVKIVVIR
jgi:hypothetical protein